MNLTLKLPFIYFTSDYFVVFVYVATKGPPVGDNMAAVRARQLNFFHVPSFNMLLHVLLGLANMFTLYTSKLAPSSCHYLGVDRTDVFRIT